MEPKRGWVAAGTAAPVSGSLLLPRDKAKRGGSAPKVSLEGALLPSEEQAEELVALDQALRALEALDPRKSRVVELRYFGGLSVEETAEVLGVSPVTVMRDWKLAKAWILRELTLAAKK